MLIFLTMQHLMKQYSNWVLILIIQLLNNVPVLKKQNFIILHSLKKQNSIKKLCSRKLDLMKPIETLWNLYLSKAQFYMRLSFLIQC